MQILSIHLKNIKSHVDTELTFSPGINVLSGPNGVGKSTVFEAIGYALFGVDAQSFVGNIERFITIGAKRGEIAVFFRVDEDTSWRVTRTVGTQSKWLLARETGAGFEVEEHKDSRETEARLKELLGLESGRSLAEQFELVIGPFQNDFLGPFVIRQPAKRRDKFDEILGIDTWRKTFNETKSLASTIKGKVEVLQAEIETLQEQTVVLPEKKGELKAAKEEQAQATEDYGTQQKLLREIELSLTAFDQLDQAIQKLQGEIRTHQERIRNGEEKIARQKILVDESETARLIVAETAAGKEIFDAAEKRLLELREQEKKKRNLEDEANKLDKQSEKLSVRLQVESRTIDRIRKELNEEEAALTERKKGLVVDEASTALAVRLPEIRSAIEDIRKESGQLEGRRAGLQEGSEKLAEGICPFFQEPCRNIADQPPQDVFSDRFSAIEGERQRLGEEINALVQQESQASKAAERLKEAAIKLQELNTQTEKLTEKRKTNEERGEGLKGLREQHAEEKRLLAEKRQTLQSFSGLDQEIETAEQQKRTHQKARDRHVTHQQQASDLEKRQAEQQRFEKLLKDLQSELTGKEATFNQTKETYDPEVHGALRRQKDELLKTVGELRQKVVGLEETVKRLSAEVDRLEQTVKGIAQKQTRVKAYAEKEELVKFLRNRVFRNVSGYLSERFREEISLRADKIYRTIAEVDEELHWGEDYRIVLRDLVEGAIRERSDDQLSGGQTMSAVVALRLAMLQTIGARIAFFDEPTSNLDAVRRENLARAFRAIDVGKEEVTEHWYDQLFLISHDVAFTEVTDQVVELGK
jgi:exonuclease SbcC